MDSSSGREIRAPCTLIDRAGKALIQTESESGADILFLKPSNPNSLYRASITSTRSDTSSTVESIWDIRSTRYSGSPVSFKEDPFPDAELHGVEQCSRSSYGEDEISNHARIPEIPDVSHASLPSERQERASIEIHRDNYRADAFKHSHTVPGWNRPEEVGSEFEDDDFDSDDDDEWGGEPDRIETAVLTNIDDLGFAAWLIVELHKDRVNREARRIGGWQRGVVNCQNSPGSGGNSQRAFANSSANQRSSTSHKRRRLSESGGRGSDDGDGERDEGEGIGPPENHDDGSTSSDPRGRYACPFNKSDSARFCSNPITGDQYRVCESGYKNIQRLKEHIKRKHLLIQCERCFQSFSGRGKAIEESVAELRRHRQMPQGCALGNPEASPGINMEQWTLLDRSGGRKKQKLSEVEKWYDIWNTIFPGKSHPEHPWAERTTPGIRGLSTPGNTQDFANLFQTLLDHSVRTGQLQLMPGQEQQTKDSLKSLAQTAYSIHTTVDGPLCYGNSSSDGQTATQNITPATPILRSPNLAGIPPGRIPRTKMSGRGSQGIVGREPQVHFGMPPPLMPAGVTYEPRNFAGYGGSQPAGVPPNAVPHPSQRLILEHTGFDWTYCNTPDDWTGFPYPLHIDPEIYTGEQTELGPGE